MLDKWHKHDDGWFWFGQVAYFYWCSFPINRTQPDHYFPTIFGAFSLLHFSLPFSLSRICFWHNF
ncbi:hypothetical protein RchiOBHm_Chr7g0231011 [Rosa chinensis]|nr:hypothetical protein RchiOBHm_Chr7g0231011 [Rosa chinensis]